jgi:hypothetical protein
MHHRDDAVIGGASVVFGHREKHPRTEEQALSVDVELEHDIGGVEHAIGTYLRSPSDSLRDDLLAALQRLDDQIDFSDAFDRNVTGSGAFGFATTFSVVGETSSNPMAGEVPGTEFRAQAALVKAAKKEVAAPTPDTLAGLRAAGVALDAVRARGSAAQEPRT